MMVILQQAGKEMTVGMKSAAEFGLSEFGLSEFGLSAHSRNRLTLCSRS